MLCVVMYSQNKVKLAIILMNWSCDFDFNDKVRLLIKKAEAAFNLHWIFTQKLFETSNVLKCTQNTDISKHFISLFNLLMNRKFSIEKINLFIRIGLFRAYNFTLFCAASMIYKIHVGLIKFNFKTSFLVSLWLTFFDPDNLYLISLIIPITTSNDHPLGCAIIYTWHEFTMLFLFMDTSTILASTMHSFSNWDATFDDNC